MEKIYSKKQPTLLLHVIFRGDFDQPRTEILDAENFLQSSTVRADEGTRFRPHRHLFKKIEREFEKAQECWVVMRGSIECKLYDIDDTVLATTIVRGGEACYTLHGGHAFTVLEDNTCVLEFKSTPYEGQAKDKVFID